MIYLEIKDSNAAKAKVSFEDLIFLEILVVLRVVKKLKQPIPIPPNFIAAQDTWY